MMTSLGDALNAGDLVGALKTAQDQARNNPQDPAFRVVLFELYSILGLWEKALTQLDVAAGLDARQTLLAQLYRPALLAEAERQKIFSGTQKPTIFGKPPDWAGLAIEAVSLSGQSKHEAARSLRLQAVEQYPELSGTLDGQPFEWISDADERMGLMVEMLINGRYFWVPWTAVSSLSILPPEQLCDAVWASAKAVWSNGGEAMVLLPVRYPASEESSDSLIRLARKTQWLEPAPEIFAGLGQRMWTTDLGDHPILDCREISFTPAPIDPASWINPASEAKDG